MPIDAACKTAMTGKAGVEVGHLPAREQGADLFGREGGLNKGGVGDFVADAVVAEGKRPREITGPTGAEGPSHHLSPTCPAPPVETPYGRSLARPWKAEAAGEQDLEGSYSSFSSYYNDARGGGMAILVPRRFRLCGARPRRGKM